MGATLVMGLVLVGLLRYGSMGEIVDQRVKVIGKKEHAVRRSSHVISRGEEQVSNHLKKSILGLMILLRGRSAGFTNYKVGGEKRQLRQSLP